jgi:hypothetical protein
MRGMPDTGDGLVPLHDVVLAWCERGMFDHARGSDRRPWFKNRVSPVAAEIGHAIGVAVGRALDKRSNAGVAPIPKLTVGDVLWALQNAGSPFSITAVHRVADSLNVLITEMAKPGAVAMTAPPPLVKPVLPRHVEQMSAAGWRD